MTVQTLPTAQLSPVEKFKLEVLPPARRQELRVSLPSHIRPELFERNFHNALMQNSWLIQHDPRLVYREIMKAAALGLLLDPQLGEGYLLESWDGKLGRRVPQFRAGYRGLMKLARQSGEVSLVYAHAVHQADKVECHLGTDKRLIHEPDAFTDRGPVVGYYAVVKFKDGQTDFEPMNRPDIDRIRDRSEGYKAFNAGKIKSTPWSTDYDEMARKTVLRRLLKRLPQSPDLAGAIAHDEAADSGQPIDVTPTAADLPMTGAQAVASALAAPVDEEQAPYDAQTGEVYAGDIANEISSQPVPAPAPGAGETAGVEPVDTAVRPAEGAAPAVPFVVTEIKPPMMPNGKTVDWPSMSRLLQQAIMDAADLATIEAIRAANKTHLNSMFKQNQDAYRAVVNTANARKAEITSADRA